MIYENSERLARAMMGKKKKGGKKEKRFMEAEWRSKPLTKRERKEKRKTQGTQGTEEEAEDYAKRASILAH
jgi:hypothetical protein